MSNWSKGWRLIVHSMNVFRAYPSFLFPILVVWGVYAAGVLYLKYDYRWALHGATEDFWVAFLAFFVMSFMILMSCATVLEMIHQIEFDEPSLIGAFGTAVGRDMFRVLPLSLVWAVIWFVLSAIEALLSKGNRDSGDDALTAQNAAMTIAGYGNFSLSEAFFDALKKGVRMVMFLIMPAIAWEHLGFFAAVKKGLGVLRAHVGEFGRGYALTYAAALIVFLPAAIVFELGASHNGHPPYMHFPAYVWVATIIYMGVAWSFTIYLEQMFMAQLYLWQMKWEREAAWAVRHGKTPPQFEDVPPPELLKKTPELFARP